MQLIEVERKRSLPDEAGLRAMLAEHGYREHGRLVETDVYYSRPDVDYMETVECLRVRSRNGFSEVTYKPPTDSSTHSAAHIISKREINVELSTEDDSDAAMELLAAIGMVELARVEKDRTIFRHDRHDDTVVSIDTIVGVGAFVETEVSAVDSTAAAEHLEHVERALSIDRLPIVTVPYRDMVIDAGYRPVS